MAEANTNWMQAETIGKLSLVIAVVMLGALLSSLFLPLGEFTAPYIVVVTTLVSFVLLTVALLQG